MSNLDSSIAAPTAPTAPARPRPMIDVSGLPESAFDWRDPVWWGNTLLMMIETVTIALIIASYFYIRRNYEVFPPPKVDVSPPIYDTAPRLLWGTINLVLMVLACAPMYVTDQFARRKRRGAAIFGLILMGLVGALCTWLRFKEFQGVYFWWNDNAYASCVWLMLGTHLTYLLATTVEFLLMLAWVVTHELDPHHALDITLCGGYWYWTAGVFCVVYAVIYFAPRMT
jgi:heme/copper-type cytochrome/quinol oxidase subunit 3